MFKVECPGCKAPYQVDERRVPSSGLKMRCPKCGTSFQVEPPPVDNRRTGPSPVFGAAPPAPAEPLAPAPAKPPPRAHKATMLGVAAPGGTSDAPAEGPSGNDPYGEIDLPTVGQPRPKRPPPSTTPGMAGAGLPAVGSPGPARPPRPAPPRPAPPRPAPPRRPGPAAPAPPQAAPPAPEPQLDADLPALVGGAGPAPPAAAPAAPQAPDSLDFGELDLPAPVPTASVPGPQPSAGFGEIDLPAPAGAGGPSFGDVDLPAPAGPGGSSFGDVDLPAPAGPGGSSFGDVDLPAVSGDKPPVPAAAGGGFGEIDLPSLSGELPAVSGDLPASAADLPSPGGALPVAAGDLPAPGGALPAPAAGLPVPGGHLPAPAAGLPAPGGSLPTPAAGGGNLPAGSQSFNELELPLVGGVGASPPSPQIAPGSDPFASSLPPPPESSPGAAPSPVVRSGGGGVGYGEVNLEGGDDATEVSLDGSPRAAREADDDMEFGAIPQERDSGPNASAAPSPELTVPAAAAAGALLPAAPIELPRPKRHGVRIVVVVLFVLGLGGAALAFVPALGPFGAYWIMDQVHAGDYRRLTQSTVEKARSKLADDTAPSAAEAQRTVASAHAGAKRVKALSAYAAYIGYARELRFGDQSEVEARAKVQLAELKEDDDIEYLALARAAQAAEQGQLARARQGLQKIAAQRPRDIDIQVTLGEIALRAREPKAALSAWQKAQAIEKSARTSYGLARARFAVGDLESARKSAEQALKQSPRHVGARVLLARLDWEQDRNEAGAMKLLTEVVKNTHDASDDEVVDAQTLLGDIHLARSRISHAETAFGEALKIDPKAAGALRGLGGALYRAGRYSEALARFEAATQADPDDIPSKVGVAKTKIALERLQDAREMMKKLREAHPKSMLVAYWYGKSEEALGARKEAEQGYRAAIANAGKEPHAVKAYVALALLLGQQGRNDEATRTLTEARKKLPDSPEIHKAMGELALSQGRYDQAITEFHKALKLDSEDVGAKFHLAVALRRSRDFDKAGKLFDQVAEVDRDYPGLALERGLLYEASGRTEEALKAYESALAKAPNDLDLMLRVGCGKVAAGRAKEAEKLLRKVLTQRPNSAETNHCLGRALLLEGTNLAEALKTLQRAVELDPNRAEYWLYVGWAANEAGRVDTAGSALKKALDIDQSLADAYWQRGVLRYRQGAVKDAIKDLRKALELRPSRNEAHAALADSYYDLGHEADAMSEWQKAITAQPDNATWRFRYGKLLVQNRKDAEARQHLAKAIELGEQMEAKPRWLWEAHYLLARAIGPKKEAAKHWEAFLRTGPRDSPYRSEAKAALAKLGRPWQGK